MSHLIEADATQKENNATMTGNDVTSSTHPSNSTTPFNTGAPPIETDDKWKENYHFNMGVTFAVTLGLCLLTIIVFIIYYQMKKRRQIQGERQMRQSKGLSALKVKAHGVEKLRQIQVYEYELRGQELNALPINGGIATF